MTEEKRSFYTASPFVGRFSSFRNGTSSERMNHFQGIRIYSHSIVPGGLELTS